MPKAAAIPARKIRKALGPELVDVVVGMERAIDDQLLPAVTIHRERLGRIDDRLDAIEWAIEAQPALPVGLTFLARLRWLMVGH